MIHCGQTGATVRAGRGEHGMGIILATELVSWLAFVGGVLLVLFTWSSIITTTILPRDNISPIAWWAWEATRKVFFLAVARTRRYEVRDLVLAYLAPVVILATLFTWLFLFFVGYALVFLPSVGGDLPRSLELSGSSMFTLGIATEATPGPVALEFLAAFTGLVVVALMIGYLPTLYGAFNRREILVTELAARAGSPPWGPEVLARHQLNKATCLLPALFTAWEQWAADVAESHTSYPWLMGFRSPRKLDCWVVSLLAVLDAAALYLAVCPQSAPAEARQFLRMGYVALRTMARAGGHAVNDDPLPTDPLRLTFEQFALGVEHLREAGFPLERDAEDAWADFRGWRVNYEDAAYFMANLAEAVPAPWSGPRRYETSGIIYDILHVRPRHRTPKDPEGRASMPAEAGRGAALRDERSWQTN